MVKLPRHILGLMACLVGLVLIVQSCRKEDNFTSDPSAKLDFSTDTVMFDTVFSQVGTHRPMSITKQFWVINNNNEGVKVDIRIAGNQYGLYKMNVDGQPGTIISQKEIRGHDSIAVFVQVYLSQVNQNTPFIVTDQLLFTTNGNVQDVDLVAYAQDAHYLKSFREVDLFENTKQITFTPDKPYLIYDSIFVPKGCVLTIDAGTKIYSHNGSAILVAGTLVVNGTQSSPVEFAGDRIDPGYKDMLGQWGCIHLLTSSTDNVITHATIKNSLIGIRVDSLSNNINPKLLLRNTTIQNILMVGILGYTADITAINNQIVNCGQFTFYGRFGGNYNLYHNTFASYNINFSRQNEHFLLDNSPLTNEGGIITNVYPLNTMMVNNIVYGSLEEELLLNNNDKGGAFSLVMQNNLLRTQKTALNTNGNLLNLDPLFVNVQNNDYSLNNNSPAKGRGVFVNVLTDIKDKVRSTTAPTIGAFE